MFADFDNQSIGYTTLEPNLDDPRFIDLASDDYHLQDGDSTSIDAGAPESLFDNEPTSNGEHINLGAYGNTTEAAISPTSYIEIDCPCFNI